ncbi:MAG: thiamine phosphate synthase [Thermoleophilaceae bacterium]|nr:thiamine phosphate synthase [Thermoleophilaceae bacterium]
MRARLYLVLEAEAAERVVPAAIAGGVDMVQLRDRSLSDDELVAHARVLASVCREASVPFLVNDRPDLAVAGGADGVHVGQDDLPVAQARAIVGADRLVGLSTHAPAELDAGLRSGADYLSVGPVWETPTKEGRPATGLEYVSYAAQHAGDMPWFAIGGIDSGRVHEVAGAGAQRVVVVRAIRDAGDPELAASEISAGLPAGAARA